MGRPKALQPVGRCLDIRGALGIGKYTDVVVGEKRGRSSKPVDPFSTDVVVSCDRVEGGVRVGELSMQLLQKCNRDAQNSSESVT